MYSVFVFSYINMRVFAMLGSYISQVNMRLDGWSTSDTALNTYQSNKLTLVAERI